MQKLTDDIIRECDLGTEPGKKSIRVLINVKNKKIHAIPEAFKDSMKFVVKELKMTVDDLKKFAFVEAIIIIEGKHADVILGCGSLSNLGVARLDNDSLNEAQTLLTDYLDSIYTIRVTRLRKAA